MSKKDGPKGLDVGTANLLVAVPADDGTQVKRQRNAFLEIESDKLKHARGMLRGVGLIEFNKRAFIVGEDAFRLANLFRKELRRPMASGTVNPEERDALLIMRLMVEKLIGRGKGQTIGVSVPAPPVDSIDTTAYHRAMIEGFVQGLGYEVEAVNEGHAVVLSSMEAEEFTGIGISLGGGMANVCIAYKGLPVVAFSVARGGDWIDRSAARAIGNDTPIVTSCKESGHFTLDGECPTGGCIVCGALRVYMDTALVYIVKQIKERFSEARDVPRFEKPVNVVLAGGTALTPGIVKVMEDILAREQFPFEVGAVRVADDPLSAVARGCLVAVSA